MPILRQAEKALRSSANKRVFNDRRRKELRDKTKEISNLISEGRKEEAQKLMPVVQKAIDKAVKSGVIKKNTASRKKSRLSAQIKKL